MTFNDVFMSTFLDFEITGFSLDSVKPIIYLYLRTGTIVHLSYDDRTLAVSDYVRCKVLEQLPEASGQRLEASGPRLEAGKPEASGKVVIIESPYRGKKAYLHYARACLYDSLMRGESPIMSHLLYPQVLTTRQRGLDAHFRIIRESRFPIIMYTDFGITDGMKKVDSFSTARQIPIDVTDYCYCANDRYYRRTLKVDYFWSKVTGRWYPTTYYNKCTKPMTIQEICNAGLWYPMLPELVIQDGWNQE